MSYSKEDVSLQIKKLYLMDFLEPTYNTWKDIHSSQAHMEYLLCIGYYVNLNQCKESTSNKIFPKCNTLILKINFKRQL